MYLPRGGTTELSIKGQVEMIQVVVAPGRTWQRKDVACSWESEQRGQRQLRAGHVACGSRKKE